MSRCKIDDCQTEKIAARGMCRKHYVFWYRRREGGERCPVETCTRPAYTNGYCATHHHHLLTKGDAEAMDKQRAIKSKLDSNGYVMIRQPGHPAAIAGSWVLEHRIVMEGKLQRYVRPDESVHHKNGNRADNRPENLELWVRYQPAGQRAEDLLAYAKEILRRYENEVA